MSVKCSEMEYCVTQ